MTKSSFELQVSVPREDGKTTPIREFGYNGATYVEGREGQQFSIKFKNNSAQRVLVVPSIDGLSVVDGEPATAESRGYIVPAYSSFDIKGWRTSLNDVNSFVFERKESGKTYSDKTGNGTVNCGVVAVKVFEEKRATVEEHHHHHYHHHNPYEPSWVPSTIPWKPHYPTTTPGPNDFPRWPEIWCLADTHYTSSVDCGSTAHVPWPGSGSAVASTCNSVNISRSVSNPDAPSFTLGAGFGQHRVDRVEEKQFERGAELATLEIYYTDAKSLLAIGIDVEKKIAVSSMPQAFSAGFCKAPKTP